MWKKIILVVLMLATSGCIASTPTEQTTTMADTQTATVQSCDIAYTPNNEELSKSEAKEFPQKPNEISRGSVGQLAVDVESVVAYNSEYDDDLDSVTITPRDVSVGESGDGFMITIHRVEVTTLEDRRAGSTAWRSFYFINESIVKRGTGPGTEDKIPQLRTIHCW
ncbi:MULTISPECIES: hypothetical protein [unclassified Haloferax]|uniref:hypothetical protein n=1 Tax=unclassified Haloferax TaxID=2625095 RepID=UPI0011C078D1|nr:MULTISPECIES: hypothetical protein [unclassified Haloferax]